MNSYSAPRARPRVVKSTRDPPYPPQPCAPFLSCRWPACSFAWSVFRQQTTAKFGDASSQPPGTSIEQPGRAPPPAAKEGTSRALLDRAGLEQRGWPAPTRHTRSTVTEGLGRALARPTQP
eukprot:scaffold25028_cov60-Phaeocystis_antarctica.AAC.4